MNTESPYDVLVIGGGPAGSGTAMRLSRLGHRVALIDRDHFPRDKPCSEYMSPETVRQLDALGVLDAIDQASGAALDGTRVVGPRGSALVGTFAKAGGTPFRATGIGLKRTILDAILLDTARDAGVQVHEGITARELTRDTAGAICGVRGTDAHGEPFAIDGRVVVGADGISSMVARRAGLHRRGRLRRVAFVAHVAGVDGVSATTELHVGRHGYIGINALGNGVANVAVVVPAEIAGAARGDATGFFWKQIANFPAIRDRFAASSSRLATRDSRLVRDVMVTGPFDAMSRRSTIDGALLVGDAADFFDPFTGEGICSALRGAALAAETLDEALQRSGPITAHRLRGYRAARRRAFLGKWIVERMIGYGMLAPALFDRAIERLDRRGMADTLIGVTGHFVSPWRVINPVFLARMVV